MHKKSIALFEVAFVALVVSMLSIFIFRGYRIFIKTSRKSSDYLNLICLSEKKFSDLQLKDYKGELSQGAIDTSGDFADTDYGWNLEINLDNTANITVFGLKAARQKGFTKTAFDSMLYLEVE